MMSRKMASREMVSRETSLDTGKDPQSEVRRRCAGTAAVALLLSLSTYHLLSILCATLLFCSFRLLLFLSTNVLFFDMFYPSRLLCLRVRGTELLGSSWIRSRDS